MPTPSTSPPPLAVRRALRDVGGHVQTWRKLRGLTQNQVADRAGIDRKSLMRVERGDGGVSFQVVLRVLHALGVLDDLPAAVDPYTSDVGRVRADEQLPKRVRPREVKRDDG
ncbi:MAG: helix-turn-helix transcriptional regulator [Solirubrobacteraceae bacterium]|nr:helix-turn-helix transcriptional regulator [Solirubrobacteraceae bacterium]